MDLRTGSLGSGLLLNTVCRRLTVVLFVFWVILGLYRRSNTDTLGAADILVFGLLVTTVILVLMGASDFLSNLGCTVVLKAGFEVVFWSVVTFLALNNCDGPLIGPLSEVTVSGFLVILFVIGLFLCVGALLALFSLLSVVIWSVLLLTLETIGTWFFVIFLVAFLAIAGVFLEGSWLYFFRFSSRN